MKSLSCTTFAAVGLVLFASGCASLPEPQAVATGEPLEVRSKTETYTYNVKKKIGEVEHKDSRGRNAGKSTLYANQKRVGHYEVWGAYQGDAKISDDDLYRIAKDETAAREATESRSRGVLMNHIGLGLAAAGIAAVAGGLALYSQQKEGADSTLSSGLVLGGGAGFCIGSYLIYGGLSKANAEHPLGQERAQQAAERYNSGLGSASTSTGDEGRIVPFRNKTVGLR
jgi:hypothetical protein